MTYIKIDDVQDWEIDEGPGSSSYEVSVDGDYIGEFEPTNHHLLKVEHVNVHIDSLADAIDGSRESISMILKLWKRLPEADVVDTLDRLQQEELTYIGSSEPLPGEVLAWLDGFAAVGEQSDSLGSRLMRAKLYSDRLKELEGIVLSVYNWASGSKE